MFQVRYSKDPEDKRAFTATADRMYTRFARTYDAAVKTLPVWRSWLKQVLHHIQGPRVLEVSFGSGWLLTQYAGRYDVFGVDLNAAMICTARRNLQLAGLQTPLIRANVEGLPLPNDMFDCVVSTTAFSGYPDGARAMREIARVLRPSGRLVMLDINYPPDGDAAGAMLANLWKLSGDRIRPMHELFHASQLSFSDDAIGGFGSVHLYLAWKRTDSQ